MPRSDRSSEIGRRFPVRFDPDPWEDDLARSTPAGRTAARPRETPGATTSAMAHLSRT
jgi:hypothetical protein